MSTEPDYSHDVVMFDIDLIKPSPENDTIYGAIDPTDQDLISMANEIIVANGTKHASWNGIREPLHISDDHYIISGHRRYAAAKIAGIKQVPVFHRVDRRDEHTPSEWTKVLVRHNSNARVKSAAVRLKESIVDIDPDIAHEQLISEREERDRDLPPTIDIRGEKVRSSVSAAKQPMLDAVVKILNGLKPYWPVTVRQLHYGLLNDPPLRNSKTGLPYKNDRKSYQDLCDLTVRARISGIISWDAVVDETRPVTGTFYHKDASTFLGAQIHHFCRNYRRDLMQSQPDHVELIVEKLTVQGIIEPVAQQFCIPMTVGRGYCSINPRYEIAERFKRSCKDRLMLLIASDFDPDGEAIAESFAKSMRDDFEIYNIEASKILLRQDQVIDWQLPPNGMEAKETSSKFADFIKQYGSNEVYELEAVPPAKMQAAVREAIEATIDLGAFNAELAREKRDAAYLQWIKNEMAEQFTELTECDGWPELE